MDTRRQTGPVDSSEDPGPGATPTVEQLPTSALVQRIRAGIIGDDEVMQTPYGRVR